MNEEASNEAALWRYRMRAAGTGALAMVAIFLIAATVYVFKSYAYIGSGVTATNTISVQGEGIVYAEPDVATFDVTVAETAKDVATAQSDATTKANAIAAYLKGQGIDAADIQTSDYSIQPQYEYQSASCPQANTGATVYCPPGKSVLTGYQVSETFTVKVRDTSKAGDLLSGVGTRGASQVSSLTFTVDNEDAVKAQARDKAIQQAEEKADALAKSLHVALVRIVGFSENTGPFPVPYAAKSMAFDSAAGANTSSPDVETGQNKITSDVTVTYEIR